MAPLPPGGRLEWLASDLANLPWRKGGRDRDGVDCWGLLRLAYRKLGIELEDFDGLIPTTARAAAERDRWHPVAFGTERPGDVALFVATGWPGHVGLVIRRPLMLHILEDRYAGLERYDGPLWRPRLFGFYRHPARAGQPA